MEYDEAIKNREKSEFDFQNNNNCFDYHIVVGGEHIAGSACPIDGDFHQECYFDFDTLDGYSEREFQKESRKRINKFLNLKNKKTYVEDTVIYCTTISLWNSNTEQYDMFSWVLQLTYCP